MFAGNGVHVHIYPRLMPTPSLSFAVRDLKCSGGVVITASHNPAKYNGYKVYGPDGCQIASAAKAIQTAIDGVDPFRDVKRLDFEEGIKTGVIRYIGEDTVERYLAAVNTASVLPAGVAKDVAIVYTPLNGAGISCVPRCLEEHGFTNITIPRSRERRMGTSRPAPIPTRRSGRLWKWAWPVRRRRAATCFWPRTRTATG